MTNVPSRVVVFCPLPPKPNGIADYFAEQIPYFSRTTKVTVVVENTHPVPKGIAANVIVLHLEEYMWQQHKYATVPHIYHVGNNPDTQYMLPVLLSKPGLVVVHDLNIHYLIDLTNLSQGDKHGYTLALQNNYGEAGVIVGQQLSKYDWKGRFMPHELMMNASIITAAERILVHSKYSGDKIAALGHKLVRIVPHHFSPAARQYQPKLKPQYRGELGLAGNKPVITSMGFIAKAKQIKAVLASLSDLKKQGLDFTYVLAGQCKPHEYDVYQDIADSGLSENVIVTGFLNEDEFFKYTLASDFIVNLRYPTGGESSGTLTRAMGMGLCCVVVNIGPFSELPDDCAVKLEWDDNFNYNLSQKLQKLISDRHYRVQIGKNAQKWVERTHSINITAQAYLEEAAQLQDNTQFSTSALNSYIFEYLTEAQILNWQSKNTINNEANNLWWKTNLLPVNAAYVANISSDKAYQKAVLVSLFGYTQEQIHSAGVTDFEDQFNESLYPAAVVDACLSDLADAPMRWLAKLNMILAIGAKLVLSLRVPQTLTSAYDLDRKSIKQLLFAAGFSVEKSVAGPRDIDMNLYFSPMSECWVFSATKRSWMVNTNPKVYKNGESELTWLYDGKDHVKQLGKVDV